MPEKSEGKGLGAFAGDFLNLDLLLVLFLVIIFVKIVPVFRLLLFFLLVVFGNGIDFDGMDLDDFHFSLALGAGQDFAFLDFVFINVNFGGTFRTPDHGADLLGDRLRVRLLQMARGNQDLPFAAVLYNAKLAGREAAKNGMATKREYPEHPFVGVGGVVIADGRALVIRRGGPPLAGEWSIPGGLLEVGETLEQGVVRELAEETGLEVRVVEIIEVLDRIFPAPAGADGKPGDPKRPQYHYVILDYLCELVGGKVSAASDAMEIAWVREDELGKFDLNAPVTRVLKKAFAMARERLAASERKSQF